MELSRAWRASRRDSFIIILFWAFLDFAILLRERFAKIAMIEQSPSYIRGSWTVSRSPLSILFPHYILRIG